MRRREGEIVDFKTLVAAAAALLLLGLGLTGVLSGAEEQPLEAVRPPRATERTPGSFAIEAMSWDASAGPDEAGPEAWTLPPAGGGGERGRGERAGEEPRRRWQGLDIAVSAR